MTTPTIAYPPETLEGWYALHQIFRFPRQKPDAARIARLAKSAATALDPARRATKARAKEVSPARSGWTCFVRLIGSTS
ncbi:MAG: hypothetical protein ABJB95_11365, partial [Gemmatimonadales bacterium]